MCGDCSAGKASIGGSETECAACVGNGTYSDTDLATFCKTAKAGYKPTEDRKGEEQCLEGAFSTGGAKDCTACSDGETSGRGAAGCSRCATCAVGRYMIISCSPITDTTCGDCLAGTSSMGGDATECTSCTKAGEYSDTDKANACKLAPAGTKPSANRTFTELCPKNHFSIGANDTCTSCPDGGRSKPGSSACELCPQYEEFDDLTEGCACMTSSDRIGRICTCKAGYTLMGTSCSPCELGKWKNESGVTSFSRCEDTLKGAITKFEGSISQSSCICPMGYYDGGKGECIKVKERMDSEVVGTKLESVFLDPGFWRTNKKSEDVRECPIPDAFIGGNETEICREGHKGHYCATCKDGY